MERHIAKEDDAVPEKSTGNNVRVKFKGSKLAMGSSKMPVACVDNDFMLKLTTLNKSMLVGAAAFVATKKKKKIDDVSELSLDGGVFAQKRKIGSSMSAASDGHLPGAKAPPEEEDESLRDRTVGILRPREAFAPSTLLSSLYPLHHNRKQLQKLVDATDLSEMNIACDYDFWVWIDAQNLFSPLSYKTHDLTVLALKDVGNEALRGRWHQPSQLPTPVPLSSSVFPHAGAFSSHLSATGTGSGPSHCSSDGGGSSGAKVALELSSKVLSADADIHNENGAGHFHAMSLHSMPWPSQEIVGQIGQTALNSGTLHLQYNNNNLSSSEKDLQCASSSSSSGGGKAGAAPSRHAATLQGFDDRSCHCEDGAGGSNSDTDGGCDTHRANSNFYSAATAMADPCAADELIEDHITQMSEELLQEHLRTNELLARLRKHALQGPAARGELEEATKAAEREKAVLARWRKAKVQQQQVGIHNSSKSGSGAGGGGAAAKAKSSHKKKLGSY